VYLGTERVYNNTRNPEFGNQRPTLCKLSSPKDEHTKGPFCIHIEANAEIKKSKQNTEQA
jgi:hypothetical protein